MVKHNSNSNNIEYSKTIKERNVNLQVLQHCLEHSNFENKHTKFQNAIKIMNSKFTSDCIPTNFDFLNNIQTAILLITPESHRETFKVFIKEQYLDMDVKKYVKKTIISSDDKNLVQTSGIQNLYPLNFEMNQNKIGELIIGISSMKSHFGTYYLKFDYNFILSENTGEYIIRIPLNDQETISQMYQKNIPNVYCKMHIFYDHCQKVVFLKNIKLGLTFDNKLECVSVLNSQSTVDSYSFQNQNNLIDFDKEIFTKPIKSYFKERNMNVTMLNVDNLRVHNFGNMNERYNLAYLNDLLIPLVLMNLIHRYKKNFVWKIHKNDKNFIVDDILSTCRSEKNWLSDHFIKIYKKYGTSGPSLMELLTHTSGLPSEFQLDSEIVFNLFENNPLESETLWNYCDSDELLFKKKIHSINLINQPGSRFVRSSVGYKIMEYICKFLANKMKLDLKEYVDQLFHLNCISKESNNVSFNYIIELMNFLIKDADKNLSGLYFKKFMKPRYEISSLFDKKSKKKMKEYSSINSFLITRPTKTTSCFMYNCGNLGICYLPQVSQWFITGVTQIRGAYSFEYGSYIHKFFKLLSKNFYNYANNYKNLLKYPNTFNIKFGYKNKLNDPGIKSKKTLNKWYTKLSTHLKFVNSSNKFKYVENIHESESESNSNSDSDSNSNDEINNNNNNNDDDKHEYKKNLKQPSQRSFYEFSDKYSQYKLMLQIMSSKKEEKKFLSMINSTVTNIILEFNLNDISKMLTCRISNFHEFKLYFNRKTGFWCCSLTNDPMIISEFFTKIKNNPFLCISFKGMIFASNKYVISSHNRLKKNYELVINDSFSPNKTYQKLPKSFESRKWIYDIIVSNNQNDFSTLIPNCITLFNILEKVKTSIETRKTINNQNLRIGLEINIGRDYCPPCHRKTGILGRCVFDPNFCPGNVPQNYYYEYPFYLNNVLYPTGYYRIPPWYVNRYNSPPRRGPSYYYPRRSYRPPRYRDRRDRSPSPRRFYNRNFTPNPQVQQTRDYNRSRNTFRY